VAAAWPRRWLGARDWSVSGGVAVGKAKDSAVAGKEMILYYRRETKHLYNKSNEIHIIF